MSSVRPRQLHRQILGLVGRPDIEDGDDVRVMEGRGELGLLHEPPAALLVGDQAGRQNLECDPTAQAGVLCFIDFAHTAGAQKGDSLVRSKAGPGSKWHGERSDDTSAEPYHGRPARVVVCPAALLSRVDRGRDRCARSLPGARLKWTL